MQRGWQPVHAARKKAGPCSNTGQHLLTLNMSLSSLHLATFKCPCLLLLHTHSSYFLLLPGTALQLVHLSVLLCSALSLPVNFLYHQVQTCKLLAALAIYLAVYRDSYTLSSHCVFSVYQLQGHILWLQHYIIFMHLALPQSHSTMVSQ